MKSINKIILALFSFSILFTSCTNDDDSNDDISGEGNITLKFDNVYNGNNLAFNTPYTNTNGEVIKVNEVKYIISNIELTKEDGSVYSVPRENNYYIINEADETGDGIPITLNNIPAANYTKVKFGIGVDEEQFNLGADGQGSFLEQAQELGMTWSWAAGYKFLKFEGNFTSSSVTTPIDFRVHTGKTGDIYNYATAEVMLPENALVRSNLTPKVHVITELSKILDGTFKINLSESETVMGGERVQNIMSQNVPQMFSVHHVHND